LQFVHDPNTTRDQLVEMGLAEPKITSTDTSAGDDVPITT
jgi:hypothetical protein